MTWFGGAEQGHVRLPDRKAGQTSIKEHLDKFKYDLAHGVGGNGGKKKKLPSEPQVKLVIQRVRDVCDGAGIIHPRDLNTDAPA